MREGIYTSYMFGPTGKRVQLILPDHRWFRSGLIGNTEVVPERGPYLPNPDPNATMLGAAQWEWLEAELKKPADGVPYPLYDLTSSRLTEEWHNVAPNKNRIGEGSTKANFSAVTIDCAKDPLITLETRDVGGKVLIKHQIKLSELR